MFDPNTPDADVLAQLRAYYPGLLAMDDNVLWAAFLRTWEKLMALMCWADGVCNTLLDAERTMIVDLSEACYPLKVYFEHKEVTSIESAAIRWLTVTGFETIEIANPNNFRNRDHYFLVLTPAQMVQINRCAGYPELELVYNAGYEEIPACLYSAIADVLTISLCQTNNCFGGDEESCYAMDRLAINSRLKSRTVGDERWDWEVPNDSLANTISDMESRGLLKMLGQYNNCFNKIHFVA